MILFVCTGNVCRSPLAEGWLLHELSRTGPAGVRVSSAGVRALVDEPVDPGTVLEGERLGLDLTGHATRQLSPELVANSRLVLTANRAQRSDVVELHPPAVQYTFTIRQLGRLIAASAYPPPVLGPVAGEDLTDALRDFAVAQRGKPTVGTPVDDDVIDPRARPADVHRRAVAQMMPSLQSVARTLVMLTSGSARADE